MKSRVGFIGTGQMATALAQGIVSSQLVAGDQITAADPAAAARAAFSEQVLGAQLTDDSSLVLRQANIIVLAVKPQVVPVVCGQLQAGITSEHLVVSIAAGVTLTQLTKLLGTQRVIRVMPNTPCLVGCGASGYALAEGASQADGAIVQQLLSATGVALELKESLLDGVTGLSGSGPAFVYLIIEALSDGGVRAGLPREVAATLAAHTVRGAAEMVLRTGEHPAVLKDRVTSPGGTTIAGLQSLEDNGLRGALICAVEEAANRSAELGRS